jgi:hypothetical protein
MQAHSRGLEFNREGYRYGSEQAGLIDVPILTAATKSVLARWSAPVARLLEVELTDEDGLATGSIVNRSGRLLRNAKLLYGTWGYRLGNLADGQRIDVGEELDLRKVKTIVAGSALATADGAAGQSREHVFAPERATALELLNVMMFYDAVGGRDFAQLASRYQAYCDLSGLLRPGMGRAILVAEVESPGSQLVDTTSGDRLGNENDFAAVVYRFVLPVTKRADEP